MHGIVLEIVEALGEAALLGDEKVTGDAEGAVTVVLEYFGHGADRLADSADGDLYFVLVPGEGGRVACIDEVLKRIKGSQQRSYGRGGPVGGGMGGDEH